MIRRASIMLLALAACATTPAPREAFSFSALLADAPAYVAARYQPSALPSALIADLTADGFSCQHSATASECGRSARAFASCFDVAVVRIAADAPVQAEQNRRCLGANP